MAFGAHDEASGWNRELLTLEWALDAQEHHPLWGLGLRRPLTDLLCQLRLVHHAGGVELDRLNGHARLGGRLNTHQGGADSEQVHAVLNDGLGDLLAVEERTGMGVGVAHDELIAAERDRAMPNR